MIVGVPRETKRDEYRVGLLPVGAELLVADGHPVLRGNLRAAGWTITAVATTVAPRPSASARWCCGIPAVARAFPDLAPRAGSSPGG